MLNAEVILLPLLNATHKTGDRANKTTTNNVDSSSPRRRKKKQKDRQERGDEDANTLQKQLENVWNILSTPMIKRLQFLSKFSSVEFSTKLPVALNLWSKACLLLPVRDRAIKIMQQLGKERVGPMDIMKEIDCEYVGPRERSDGPGQRKTRSETTRREGRKRRVILVYNFFASAPRGSACAFAPLGVALRRFGSSFGRFDSDLLLLLSVAETPRWSANLNSLQL